jgi:hypothetical protein
MNPKPEMSSFVAKYGAANYSWAPLDRILLKACADQPLHQDISEVFAKVTLINRAYRANLQMAGTNVEEKLAKLLVEEEFDKVISSIAAMGKFRSEIVDEVVAVHEKFVLLTYRLTKQIENSFCAKYLGFHFPRTIPIFDNYAYTEARRLVADSVQKGPYAANKNAHYGYYCMAVVQLMTVLMEAGIGEPDIKLIDVVLYGSGAGNSSANELGLR